MRAPYGLNIIDNCVTCPVREEHLFCNLPAAALQKLNEIKSTAVYPKSAMLFIEGQQPRGVFVLCAGKVKLSTSSKEGKTIITKLSDPGDVLGLNATISNRPYEVTAEMVEPGQANFIARDAFLQFLTRAWRSRGARGRAAQPQLLHRLRRNPNVGTDEFASREVRQAAAFLVP